MTGSLSLNMQQLVEHLHSSLEQANDQEAINQLTELRYRFAQLYRDFPDFEADLKQKEASELPRILGKIRDRLAQEATEQDSSRLKGLLANEGVDLAGRVRELMPEPPPWLRGLEHPVARMGALEWRKIRKQPEAAGAVMALRSEFRLLARFAQLVEPVPAWVAKDLNHLLALQWRDAADLPTQNRRDALRQACAELASCIDVDEQLRDAILAEDRSAAEAAPAEAGDGGNSQLEAQLRELVDDWLEEVQVNPAAGELGLVFIPGARIAPHQRNLLQFNLAAITDGDNGVGGPAVCDRMIEVFFEQMRNCSASSTFRLLEPVSALYDSLGLLWRTGERVTVGTMAQLMTGITSWNRCGGPGALGARLQPPSWPLAQLAEGRGLVVPTQLEMASLQCVLQHPAAEVEEALTTIRRNHHNGAWMGSAPQQGWLAGPKPEDPLRRLHSEAGFYANSLAPLDCLQCWSEGTLSALLNLQVVGGGISPLFFTVAQTVFGETGRVLELHRWPDHQRIFDFLAGREVVVVSPLAEEVEAQHRSRRAFDLFHDLQIRPYGLRCVKAVDSTWPNRPEEGFTASLNLLLEQIDRLYRELPFSVLIASCGSYSLPICNAVQGRYGVSCLRNDAVMHSYFGITSDVTATWRLEQRISGNWVHRPGSECWMAQR